jgi:hypothetical protein
MKTNMKMKDQIALYKRQIEKIEPDGTKNKATRNETGNYITL